MKLRLGDRLAAALLLHPAQVQASLAGAVAPDKEENAGVFSFILPWLGKMDGMDGMDGFGCPTPIFWTQRIATSRMMELNKGLVAGDGWSPYRTH